MNFFTQLLILQHVIALIANDKRRPHRIYLHIVVGILVRCGGTCLERPGTDADVRWLTVVRQRRLHHCTHLSHRKCVSATRHYQPNCNAHQSTTISQSEI